MAYSDKHKEILTQFVKFCLIGVLNTLVDFLIYLFFSRIVGLYFLYANLISVFVAMSCSFILNKYWTFKNHDKRIKTQYLKFAFVNVVYFILNNGIVFCLVHYFGSWDLGAKLAATFVGLFWSFFANKYWTFRLKKAFMEK